MQTMALNLMFGFFGMGMETFFTAIDVAWQKMMRGQPYTDLDGYSSVWYFPLYFFSPMLFDACRNFGLLHHHLVVRGTVYAMVFLAAEYIGMALVKKLVGRAPNEKIYLKSRWNVNGLIKLSLAPAWFFAGLMFEQLFLIFSP